MTNDVEHLFICCLPSVYLRWGVSVQAFCTVFNWVICFLIDFNIFIHFGWQYFIRYIFYKYFLQSMPSLLSFLDSVFCRAEVFNFNDVQLCCCSVTQLCPTLCHPMDCSTTGFPVLHCCPEFAKIHIHWVGDAIQPSHPLFPPSPPPFNLSQHQGLFQWVGYSQQVAKVLELQHPSN